jgi:preprotein translocase subunit SecF
MSLARNINFIGQSKPLIIASVISMLTSWVLIASGQLELGIDFAGGTEALVSVPSDLKVSDAELQEAASSIGLVDPQIVNYTFQDDKSNQGFFIRSKSNGQERGGLAREKGEELRAAISSRIGAELVTWDDKANTFTITSEVKNVITKAFNAEKITDDITAQAIKGLKEAGVTLKAGVFSAKADQKKAVTQIIGNASMKIWDTSEESGERVRVRFYQKVNQSVLQKAADTTGVAGVNVSAENKNKLNPVFVITADDSVRLVTAVRRTLKTKLDALNAKLKAKDPKSALMTAKVQRFEKVGATAGQQLRNKGILAVVYALIFILFYIALRFDPRYSPGAIVALLHDVTITLGVFCLTGREFNLPIIAALLAIVGYLLNDTIVVYDRIRENQDEAPPNSSLKGIINASINDCLSRTVLTSVTTFIAVLAIKFFGGGIIENFAFAMLIGVLVGTYSSIYIASPLVLKMDEYLRKREERNAAVEKALS